VSRDRVVMGVTPRGAAERIVDELRRAGFEANTISLMLSGKALEGPLATSMSMRSVAIRGLAPFRAAGPLLAGLSGPALGGLAGALIVMGIPERAAKAYEGRLRRGDLLIAAHALSYDLETRARDILRRSNALDVSSASP